MKKAKEEEKEKKEIGVQWRCKPKVKRGEEKKEGFSFSIDGNCPVLFVLGENMEPVFQICQCNAPKRKKNEYSTCAFHISMQIQI